MKNILLFSGFLTLSIACGSSTVESTAVEVKSTQLVQEIEQTEAAVITLDSINQEIQKSSDQLDALLQDLD